MAVGLGGTDEACPACRHIGAELVLELPPIPVHVGLLWRTPAEAASCAKGQFRLALCETCGYVWNAAFDPTLLSYDGDYDNALHFSPKFASWERDLADHLVQRHDLHARTIAEIGCGDGRFLAMLCLAGDNDGVGFEPGFNGDRASELVATARVRIHDEFADANSLRGVRADFVAARHLLEHLPVPTVLTDAIRNGMTPGSAVYVEVPNFSWTLQRGAFEDLMYEHTGYYTIHTLEFLFESQGFVDSNAEATFDGLFAAIETTVGASEPGPNEIDPTIVAGIKNGIEALRHRIDRVDEDLAALADSGQRIAAWGGGARAVGLMNLVPSAEAIEMVVDVNPRKQGTYVTGTGHPILAPEALVEFRPDTVIVVNPVYLEEIERMLADLDVDTELVTI